MYRDDNPGRETQEGLRVPSDSLKITASAVIADSLLMHRASEERDRFREELAEAMEESDEKCQRLLAGMKEVGLDFKNVDGKISLLMRHPKLSNPDPAEFSTQVIASISRPTGAAELLEERGGEVLGAPEAAPEMEQWLENMEVAVQNAG